jgi:hypothetical protein
LYLTGARKLELDAPTRQGTWALGVATLEQRALAAVACQWEGLQRATLLMDAVRVVLCEEVARSACTASTWQAAGPALRRRFEAAPSEAGASAEQACA